jgi:hypothetical protein
MSIKRVGLALIASLSLIGTPYAQTPQSAPSGGGGSSRSTANADAVATAVTVGWNYVHATNCLQLWDGTYNWLYVYPAEGGVRSTASPAAQTVLAPACQTGNWVAFYVYNTNGNWSYILTFPYK